MRNNIEAAGVHLADCTLLWCRHETKTEEERLAADVQRRISLLGEEYPPTARDIAKQEASPHVRVDGEIVATNLALRYLTRAEEERKARFEEERRQREEREALGKKQDEIRHIIIDNWAFGMEELEKLQWIEHGVVKGKERRRLYVDWYDSGVQQHLVDEARLWSDLEQVIGREREAGRKAYELSKGKPKRGSP